MHFARFQITAAAAEYFNRIRQVAKRIANIRLTKQKKTDTWQIVRMPVSCFYLLVFQKRSVIMLRFRSSLHELLTVLFERLHREFQLLQRKSHLLRCTERKLQGTKPGSCFLLQWKTVPHRMRDIPQDLRFQERMVCPGSLFLFRHRRALPSE